MSSYLGMRWFRSDLQVQTPEDAKHWDQEDPLRLGEPRRPGRGGQHSEEDIQEKARKYLRRCQELELEVLGVTDHNFSAAEDPRDWFLTHLLEQNDTVARESGRDPLVIFPGFEVDIGYHVLCLFEPCKSSNLGKIGEILTRLGLAPAKRRRLGSTPAPLRFDNQYVSLAQLLRVVQDEEHGLVIAAHAFETSGIAYDATYESDYVNKDLLCVEVPCFPLAGRAAELLDRPSGVWAQRDRRPSYILSSDAKSTLPGTDGKPKPGSLGHRFTWIKMSRPSIESLRQAFLDPVSRLRPGQLDPRQIGHVRIASIEVKGAKFLEDQEVQLSPHLNCIIGGRGSGKSSLFEYARFALRKDDDLLASAQVGRIGKTFGPEATVSLTWKGPDGADGEPTTDTAEYRPGTGKARVVSRDVIDAPAVFRSVGVQMFSQGQITRVATPEDERPGFLLSVVDQLVGQPLEPLLAEESATRERLLELAQKRRQAERVRAEVSSLSQEVADLERSSRARSAVQEAQRRVRLARDAASQIDAERVRAQTTAKDLEDRAEEIQEARAALGSEAESWPEAALLRDLDKALMEAEASLASEITAAAARYRRRAGELLLPERGSGRVADALRTAEEALSATCREQGIAPGEVDRLRKTEDDRKAKLTMLELRRGELAALDAALAGEKELRESLHDIWRRQTMLRNTVTRRITESEVMPKVPAHPGHNDDTLRPSVSVCVRACEDRADLLDRWRKLAPDARTRLGKAWEEIGAAALSSYGGDPACGSPWAAVDLWLDGRASAPEAVAGNIDELRQLLHGSKRETWETTRLERVRDAVDVVLYRDDGTEAGSLDKGRLSDGQRNTAVLALILAGGEGPILIDQPEEELDSDFVFHQLVPMIRKVKERRQVVLVTHNANIPVNGDAELIHALDARLGSDGSAHGKVRASGGLDQRDVKDAVLDVMEGSEDAFEQRRRKYRF